MKQVAFVLIVLFLFCEAILEKPHVIAAEDSQLTALPNILFIMTDQQRWDCL